MLEPANSGIHALGSNMGDPWLVGAVVFVGCAVAGTLWHLGGTTHFKVEGQGRLFRDEDLLVKEIQQQRKEMQQLRKEIAKKLGKVAMNGHLWCVHFLVAKSYVLEDGLEADPRQTHLFHRWL